MPWEIKALGIKSSDFISSDGNSNAIRSAYGSKWKYADKHKHQETFEAAARPVSSVKQKVEDKQDLIQNETEQNEQYATPKFTASYLNTATKEEVVEIASALGIANIDMPKKKLIEAVLEKQTS